MDEQLKLQLSIGVGVTVQKISAGYTATVDTVTATVAPPLVTTVASPRVPSPTTTTQVEDTANVNPTTVQPPLGTNPTTTTQVEDTANVSPTTVQPPLGTNPTTTQVEDTENVSPTTGTSTALTPTTPMVPANVALNLITSTGFSMPPSFTPAVGNPVISSGEQAQSPRKRAKTEGTYTGTTGTGLGTDASSSRVTTHGNEDTDTYMTDTSKNSPLKRDKPDTT